VVGAACVAVVMAAVASIEAATANIAETHGGLRHHRPGDTVQATRSLRQTTRRPEAFPQATSRAAWTARHAQGAQRDRPVREVPPARGGRHHAAPQVVPAAERCC
jgi:hypothetical protein